MPTFVVEDGTGLANATSLCSVATANDHWSTHPDGSTLWDALHTEEKEAKLIHASLLVSRRLRWRGAPVSATQAFPVPASGLYDHRQRSELSTVVPADVARGVAELAGLFGRAGVVAGETPAIKSQSTGPVSVTYAGSASAKALSGIPSQVLQYLEPYVFTSPRVVRA